MPYRQYGQGKQPAISYAPFTLSPDTQFPPPPRHAQVAASTSSMHTFSAPPRVMYSQVMQYANTQLRNPYATLPHPHFDPSHHLPSPYTIAQAMDPSDQHSRKRPFAMSDPPPLGTTDSGSKPRKNFTKKFFSYPRNSGSAVDPRHREILDAMTPVDWRWAAKKGYWDPRSGRWNEKKGGIDAYVRQRDERKMTRAAKAEVAAAERNQRAGTGLGQGEEVGGGSRGVMPSSLTLRSMDLKGGSVMKEDDIGDVAAHAADRSEKSFGEGGVVQSADVVEVVDEEPSDC
jgi:hypothetical protein